MLEGLFLNLKLCESLLSQHYRTCPYCWCLSCLRTVQSISPPGGGEPSYLHPSPRWGSSQAAVVERRLSYLREPVNSSQIRAVHRSVEPSPFSSQWRGSCVCAHPSCEREAAVSLELIGELKQRCDSALFHGRMSDLWLNRDKSNTETVTYLSSLHLKKSFTAVAL